MVKEVAMAYDEEVMRRVWNATGNFGRPALRLSDDGQDDYVEALEAALDTMRASGCRSYFLLMDGSRGRRKRRIRADAFFELAATEGLENGGLWVERRGRSLALVVHCRDTGYEDYLSV